MKLDPELERRCLELADKIGPSAVCYIPGQGRVFHWPVFIPLKLVSEANVREHWAKKNRRKKDQQALTTAMLNQMPLPKPGPVKIILARVGGKRMDGDNLQRAFKGIRDAVAKSFLEIDDGDSRLTWIYEQRGRKRGEPCGVEIEVIGVRGEEITLGDLES